MLALVGALAPSSAAAADEPRAVVAVLPYGTTVERVGSVPGLAPGIVSAGLGPVGVAQTFLDVSQGNRVNEALYDRPLPRLYLRDGQVPERLWSQVQQRAASAPSTIVPGLLAATLAEAGVAVAAEADSGLATLAAVDRNGVVRIADPDACKAGCGAGLSVVRARPGDLGPLVEALRRDDLLVAVAAGSRADQELLPVGVAGRGFAGNLTSDSTRTDGVVTTTDISYTLLDRLGVEPPDEFNGTEIRSTGERDPAAVADLQGRLDTRPDREYVVLLPLGIWIGLCGLAAAIWRGRGARLGLRLLAPAAAWAPALLLAAAALDASTLAAGLLLGVGSVALAAAGASLASGYLPLAVACGVTVAAYAIDVVAGSPLTALSVLGPNPGAGVRFFGIGNELEAVLTTLTLAGTGAALSTRPGLGHTRAAVWFVAVAVVAIAAFAPGRFGADVGAAIVLGVGGATAAVLALGLRGARAVAWVVGGGLAALAALVAIDLVLGGAHLSRTVLGAGEAGDVVDVFDRRVTLMANTFAEPVYPELLAVAVVLLVAGAIGRRIVLAWFGDAWAARCGFLGALAGVLVGTIANDSGSVLLVIGTIYLSILAGFAWAVRSEPAPSAGAR